MVIESERLLIFMGKELVMMPGQGRKPQKTVGVGGLQNKVWRVLVTEHGT